MTRWCAWLILAAVIVPLRAAPGVPSGSLALNELSPSLGDEVTFAYAVAQLPKSANPRIQVLCYQGDVLVYGEAGPAWQVFLLGGASSPWLQVGGAASCVATLYYWQFHPRQVFHHLASITFEAGP